MPSSAQWIPCIPEHTFNEKDFVLKHNDAEIAMDSNFAAQLLEGLRVRFFRKKRARCSA